MNGELCFRAGNYRVVISEDKCGKDVIEQIYYMILNSPGLQRLYYSLPEIFVEILCGIVEEYCGERSCEKQRIVRGV